MCSRAQVATLPRLGELVSLRGASNPCGPVKQYNCALLRCDEQASVHLRLPGRAHVQIVEEVVNVPFEAADGLRVHDGGFEGRAVMVSLQHPDDKPEAMDVDGCQSPIKTRGRRRGGTARGNGPCSRHRLVAR